MIRFHVRGTPQPQGSMRVRNGYVTSANPNLKAWRDLVAKVAQDYAPAELLSGPIAISLVFGIQRPPSAPKSRVWPITRPDSDKLARSILDALKGIIWIDDSQVVKMQVEKVYGIPGVEVEINAV